MSKNPGLSKGLSFQHSVMSLLNPSEQNEGIGGLKPSLATLRET